MKLKSISEEELLLLSYTDIANMILKENQKAMNTPTIFKEICRLLKYNDEVYEAKIGDFYTSLTTDKRFILLSSGEWDLKDKHSVPLEIDEEDDVEEPVFEEEEEEVEETEEVLSESDDIDDDVDEDMEDLTIIDEETEKEPEEN